MHSAALSEIAIDTERKTEQKAENVRVIAIYSGSTIELPDMNATRDVCRSEETLVGRKGNGAEPVLELTTARRAEDRDFLAVLHLPHPHTGVAADRDQVLAV